MSKQDGATAAGESRRVRMRAWRERMRSNPATRPWYRAGVAVVGALLVVGSALTGWLPGPGGIPLFIAGLAIWASEFAWAARLRDWTFGQGRRYQQLGRGGRWAFWGAVIVLLALFWYAIALVTGVPDWLPDALEHRLEQLPGL